jgi:hypothetical protein
MSQRNRKHGSTVSNYRRSVMTDEFINVQADGNIEFNNAYSRSK